MQRDRGTAVAGPRYSCSAWWCCHAQGTRSSTADQSHSPEALDAAEDAAEDKAATPEPTAHAAGALSALFFYTVLTLQWHTVHQAFISFEPNGLSTLQPCS